MTGKPARVVCLVGVLLVPPEPLPVQGPAATLLDTQGATTEVTSLGVAITGGAAPRTVNRFLLHLIFYPNGATSGVPSARIHQLVELKLDKIRSLTLSGDWCASPPTGGIDLSLRDGRRITLAGSGPTTYEVRDPRPKGIGASAPVAQWNLEGETVQGTDGRKQPAEIMAFVGRGAGGAEISVSLCKLRTLTISQP